MKAHYQYLRGMVKNTNSSIRRNRLGVLSLVASFTIPCAAVHLLLMCTCAAGLCFTATSCKKDEARRQLRVAVREGLEAKGIQALAESWGKQERVNVSVQTLGRENYEIDVTNDLLSSQPKYDVVFLPGTLVAEMAQEDAIAPIKNWSPAQDPDLLGYSSYDKRIYGLPCDVSTFFLFYRKDIVEAVPATWEDLLETIPRFSKQAGADVETAFGLAFAGKAGEELPKIFYPILWSYGGFIIEHGRVGLDAPEALEAAEMFRKLATSDAIPPDLQTWDVGKILDELQRGTVAISAPQWNALFPLIRNGSSDVRDRIEIAPLPGVRTADGQLRRVNFRHTWVLVKSARATQHSLANDFILFATGKEGARMYAETAHGNPARVSVLSDVAFQELRPEFPLLLESLRAARAEPDVPFYARMHRVMNDALSAIIAGTRSPEDAMADAARRVRDLVSSGS